MKGLILTVLGVGLCGAALTPDQSISEPVRLRIVANKIQPPIRHARDESARAWSIPIPIFKAMELIESSGGKHLRAYGKAEKKYARKLLRAKPGYVAAAARAGWSLRQLATSYGPMHVLGVNYYQKGYKPSDVDDLELNYELAANYVSSCEAKKGKGNWRGILLCYNGGADPTYPVKVARVAIAFGMKSKNG